MSRGDSITIVDRNEPIFPVDHVVRALNIHRLKMEQYGELWTPESLRLAAKVSPCAEKISALALAEVLRLVVVGSIA